MHLVVVVVIVINCSIGGLFVFAVGFMAAWVVCFGYLFWCADLFGWWLLHCFLLFACCLVFWCCFGGLFGCVFGGC